ASQAELGVFGHEADPRPGLAQGIGDAGEVVAQARDDAHAGDHHASLSSLRHQNDSVDPNRPTRRLCAVQISRPSTRVRPSAITIFSFPRMTRLISISLLTSFADGSTWPVNFTSPTPSARPRPGSPSHGR